MECIQFIFDARKNCKQDKPILITIYNKRKMCTFKQDPFLSLAQFLDCV